MEDPNNKSEEGEYIAPTYSPGHTQAKEVATTFWKTAFLREKAVIILGVLYVLSPLDLIPEVILGPLGLLDDGGAIFVVLLIILGILKRQKGVHDRTALPDK